MKTKAKKLVMNEGKQGDMYVKQALLQAQGLMERSKISDEVVWLQQSEKKFNSFLETYLTFSGIFCAVLAIAAVLLAIVFPPNFMRVTLADNEGFLRWLFVVLYILAVALLSVGFVFGLFFSFDAILTSFCLRHGKKLDEELIRWSQSTWRKMKSHYTFERLKQDRKYRSSYGYWQSSLFWTEKKFYDDAGKLLADILSKIQETSTQEQVDSVVAEKIEAAKEQRDTDALILACYLSQYRNFETLKKKLQVQ